MFTPLIELILRKYNMYNLVERKKITIETKLRWSQEFNDFFTRTYALDVAKYTEDVSSVNLEPVIIHVPQDRYSFASYPRWNKNMNVQFHDRDAYALYITAAG